MTEPKNQARPRDRSRRRRSATEADGDAALGPGPDHRSGDHVDPRGGLLPLEHQRDRPAGERQLGRGPVPLRDPRGPHDGGRRDARPTVHHRSRGGRGQGEHPGGTHPIALRHPPQAVRHAGGVRPPSDRAEPPTRPRHVARGQREIAGAGDSLGGPPCGGCSTRRSATTRARRPRKPSSTPCAATR